MKTFKKILPFLVLTVIFVLLTGFFANAAITDDIKKNLGDVGAAAGYQGSESGNLPTIVGRIINVFLGILGVIFVILIVYGGYTWMTSFGNTQKVTKAKDLIIDAVIGLIVILAAYAISNFVVNSLIKATAS